LQMILNKKRERRGSIDFDLPEPVIEFDEDGLMKSVTRSERNSAHRIIEEFMLSANETVAGYLEGKGLPSLYRIHEKPDAKRVYDFEVIAATFGYSLGVGALPIKRMQFKTDRRASYGTGKRARDMEIPQDVHITPRMYQKLTEKIAGKPEERILSYLMLRSLKQARYSEENEGHFALAATTYTHFTSPIRRYPDLIVHRILKDVLRDSAEIWDGNVPVGSLSPMTTGQLVDADAELNRRFPVLPHAAIPAPEGRANLAQRRGPQNAASLRSGVEGGSAGKAKGRDQVPEGRRNSEEDRLVVGREEASRGHGFSHADSGDKTPDASPPQESRAGRPRQIEPASPWSKRREREPVELKNGPIPLEDLHAIAEESSQSERRADEAERELMEWKKAKFMQDRIGEDFDGLIISVTKFGFFVELADLFVEGLVPLATLTDDRYTFHENTRQIIGQHSRRAFQLGDKIRVLVDRIDPVEKKIQFALLETPEPSRGKKKRRK
jgi:exoribonuclease R